MQNISLNSAENQNFNVGIENSFSITESKAQAAFLYFLKEIELDDTLTPEEQENKIFEFKNFSDSLSSEVVTHLTHLLIEKTRSHITEMLKEAELSSSEVDKYLIDYEEIILKEQNMNLETVREMLFFVEELKIHRRYVYDFGVALGCPLKQLLRHDLCKLDKNQFEGYARYFRGGRQEKDKSSYLAAWEFHQYEEHHHQSYSKEGFCFETFSEERLRNNMLETTADLLAATKQRGGSTLIDYLLNIFPKQHPHPRLIPFLEEALKKAHTFYLESEKNADTPFKLFRGLPCWSTTIEEVFAQLKKDHSKEKTEVLGS